MSNKATVYFHSKWKYGGDEEDLDGQEVPVDPFEIEGEVAVNFERNFVVVSEETDEYQLVQHFFPKHEVAKIEFSMNKKNSSIVTPIKKENENASDS